ncbi:MAG: hypothetical protein OXR62_13790 [Ahrensia sp.]|nr:hypothetical protein [Ahrensia sp.]
MRRFKLAILGLLLAPVLTASALAAGKGEMVEVKGEIIDTWCYFSGVMGGPDAVTGSAHHTCALWCAAGGIPIGMRTEDGQVYMVLKVKDENPLEPTDTVLELQSDVVTAKGTHFKRDGIDYIVVADIVANDGITKLNHEDYGPVPPFSGPKKKK